MIVIKIKAQFQCNVMESSYKKKLKMLYAISGSVLNHTLNYTQ